MDLKAVRIKNFFSIKEAVVPFDGEGTTLVLGATGSGKSALLVEPLLWQFYDSLNREAGRGQMSGVHRNYHGNPVDEDTEVETWFSNFDHEYYVKRSLKNGWEIHCDGQPSTPYKKKGEGVDAMDKIIRLPEHLFRSIAVMGQGFSQKFTGFKDSDRTSIIEDFLGAAEFEQGRLEAKDKSKVVETELGKLTVRREACENSVQRTRGEIETARTNAESVRQGANQTRQTLSQEREFLTNSRQEWVNHQKAVSAEFTTLSGNVQTAQSQNQLAFENVTQLTSHLSSTKTSIQAIGSAIAKLSGLSDKCPTCLQTVDPGIVSVEVQRLQGEQSDLSTLQTKLETDLQTARNHQQECSQAIQGLNSQKDNKQAELNKATSELSRIDNRINQIDETLRGLDSSDESWTRSIQQLEQRLAVEQSELEKAYHAETEYKNHQPYVGWWSEGFSIRGIRSRRLNGVLDKMNVQLRRYSQALFDDLIRVQLLPMKEQKTAADKSVVTVDVSGPAGCYEMCSGGQERCIDLAIHFALRGFARDAAFGWSSNFLIGDEVFDHLDRKLSEKAFGLLSREARRVFVMSHSPELKALCNSVWNVRYRDEITELAL